MNHRQTLSRGRLISSKLYRDTKEALAWETRSQWQNEALVGSVALDITLYFGDKRKRDVDSYLKILLDALSGIVYEDDNQVITIIASKEYDKENPRVEITPYEIIGKAPF